MVIALWAGLGGTGHAAETQAVELKEGSVACRSERALEELLKAGPDQGRKWLFDGFACLRLSEPTLVRLVSRNERGIQQLRTLDRRRNIDLWIKTETDSS